MYLGPVPFEREIIKRPLTAPASYTIGKWSEERYGDRIQGPAGSYYSRYIVYAMTADRHSQAFPHCRTAMQLESHSVGFAAELTGDRETSCIAVDTSAHQLRHFLLLFQLLGMVSE